MSEQEDKKTGEQMGTLGGCLIEGDSEQKARERKVKRRAIAISIGLQSAALVALVVTPLLAKTEKLAFTVVTSVPPYRPASVRPEGDTHRPSIQRHGICLTCIHNVSPTPISHDGTTLIPPTTGDEFSIGDPSPDRSGLLSMIGTQSGPKAPTDTIEQKKRITVGGAVQQAMLMHRVEPGYPPLARQLHRSGQVHIRALISIDGTIASLKVLDGDPLLVQSARDAVSQWKYKPTYLNGQAVEVETVITVIYTLNQ